MPYFTGNILKETYNVPTGQQASSVRNVNRPCCSAMTGWLSHSHNGKAYPDWLERIKSCEVGVRHCEAFKCAKEVGSVQSCVFILSPLSGQQTTMARKPTIQTTVTASLTKSSQGACSLTSPVKPASKCVCVCENVSLCAGKKTT